MTPRILVLAAALTACATGATAGSGVNDRPAEIPAALAGQEVAVLAGGCFWCLESDFDKLDGIVHTTSGYAGGSEADPSYYAVGSGGTGHTEVVRVVYDKSKLDYGRVLDYFMRHIDPTDAGGQFCDRGDQYRPAVFPADEAQRAATEQHIQALDARGVLPGKVAVTIESGTFYAAENYHQDYHLVNPGRYLPYRMGCGRDKRVAEVWRQEG